MVGSEFKKPGLRYYLGRRLHSMGYGLTGQRATPKI